MKQQGFTIVELIIVTIVIGILATISIVAYNGVQAKARDNTRIEHLQKIADAIQMYRAKNGNDIQTGSGCGNGGNGGGWFNYSGGAYPASILSCLTAQGYLDNSYIDPSGCAAITGACTLGKGMYMKYSCTYNGQTITILYARLETEDETSKITGFNGGVSTCNSGTVTGSYGMNYMVIAD